MSNDPREPRDHTIKSKRLSQSEKERLESDLYDIFQAIDLRELSNQLRTLRDMREELLELQKILELSKSCLEKCTKKGLGSLCC